MDDLELKTSWTAGGKLDVEIRNGEVVHADRVDPVSQVSRARFLKGLIEKLPGVDRDEVERELLKLLDAKPDKGPVDDDPGQHGDEELQKTPEAVLSEAREILRSPKLINQVLYDAEELGITGEHELCLTNYILGTSRLLNKPLAGVVQGSSSSGKSHLIEKVASMFPKEVTLLATDMTPNALYYLPYGSLRHRFVVAGERSRKEDDDRAEATRALREMISSGVLRKAVPVKVGNRFVTEVIENPGPIAYIESTTLPELFEEDRNRMILLGSDDSDEQTRRVLDAIAGHYADPSSARDSERIIARHHAVQRMLRRVVVEVPFARALAQVMPVDRPEARRAIHHLMVMVQAIALLNQFQRIEEPFHGATIQALLADYEIARGLLLAPLGRSLGGALPEHVTSFGRWLESTVKKELFTVQGLRSKPGCRWPESTLYRHVKSLRAEGVVVADGKDGQSTAFKIVAPLPTGGAEWLPTVAELEGGF